MRILHLLPHLSGGGAERQMSYLLPELSRMGHQVDVGFLREGLFKVDLGDVRQHRLRARSNYDPGLVWQMVRLIRRTRPDVVHTWIEQMDVLGGIAARLTRTPQVLREPASAKAYPDSWKRRLRTWAGRSAAAIVSNSEAGDRYWSSLRPRARRYIISNALPLDEIERTAPGTKTALGVPADRQLVLYAGRLADPQKNLDRLVEALHPVCAQYPVDVVLCGDGPYRSSVESAIAKTGMADRFHLMGQMADVWPIMKAADLFVSVSLYEGRPNSVMEAMACGCPLVVSDIPEHREFLDERSAFIANPEDVAEITCKLESCLNDPTATQQKAVAAKEATRPWSITAMAQQYVQVYREASNHHMEEIRGV